MQEKRWFQGEKGWGIDKIGVISFEVMLTRVLNNGVMMISRHTHSERNIQFMESDSSDNLVLL